MVELFCSIWKWITRKEKSSAAIEGFDLLSISQREFNTQILRQLNAQNRRLNECEDDRNELHAKVGGLEIKVDECEQDRQELRERMEAVENKTQ